MVLTNQRSHTLVGSIIKDKHVVRDERYKIYNPADTREAVRVLASNPRLPRSAIRLEISRDVIALLFTHGLVMVCVRGALHVMTISALEVLFIRVPRISDNPYSFPRIE